AVMVLADDHDTADDQRRIGSAEIVLEWPHRQKPKLLAGRGFVANQAAGTEEANYALAVRRRRALAVAGNGMYFLAGPVRRLDFPKLFAGAAVKRDGQQFFPADGVHENSLPVNDGRRMARRQLRFPQHIRGWTNLGRQLLVADG